MSLKDTIQGARAEVAANSKPAAEDDKAAGKGKAAASADPPKDDPEAKPTGFAKKSVTRAKPARQAASSVTVVSASGKTKSKKNMATMSKDEQKEERRRQREAEDRVDTVAQILLDEDPAYKELRKKWWIIMGVGFGCLVLSFIPLAVAGNASADYSTPAGFVSIVFMVLAYVFIIWSFVFDWRKIRPLRKVHTAEASGMTVKRLQAVLDRDRQERAAAKAQKDAAKAAKGKK